VEKMSNEIKEFDLTREEVIARHEMDEQIQTSLKMSSWIGDYENSIVSLCDRYGVDPFDIDQDPDEIFDESRNPHQVALRVVRNAAKQFGVI
jgi:chitinase